MNEEKVLKDISSKDAKTIDFLVGRIEQTKGRHREGSAGMESQWQKFSH